jgi:hypothetical protein
MRIPGLSVLLLILLTPVLFGQAFTSLTGVVTDPSGAVVPGATITIVNTQTGAQRETISNEVGGYSFPQVVPGTYKLTAKMAGFTTTEIKDIRLQVNSPATLNVKFEKVGGVFETVTVTASSAMVNTTDASLGNAIAGSTILQLPSYARNVVNLLLLQPGVTEDGQVNGGKSDQANVTLDGVDINDQVNRSVSNAVLRVTLDSVQEFRTTTTNTSADQGRGSGAEIALVTKGGSNQFHGSLYEYNRNENFVANDFFTNRNIAPVYKPTGNTCTPQQLAQEFDKCKAPIPALKINIFGASFGGPIIENRLFMFANYDGRRDASASVSNRTVATDDLRNGIVNYHDKSGALRKIGPAEIKQYADPTGIGVNPNSLKVFNLYPRCNVAGSGDLLNTCTFQFNAPRHTKQDTYIAKVDYVVDQSGKHQVFVRGNLQNDHADGTPNFPGQPPSSVTLSNNKGLATGYTWVIRPNIVNSLRYGLTRQGGESTGLRNSPVTTFRGYQQIYATGTNSKRTVPVHTISDDFSWIKSGHDFRFGVTIRTISNQTLRNDTFHSATTNASGLAGSGAELYQNIPGGLLSGDTVSYTYAMAALLGLISQVNATYKYVANPDGSATVVPQGGNVALNFVGDEYELYAQDSWKIRNNLTITGGIRYSIMPAVHEANGQQTSPDIPLAEWLGQRGALAAQGRSQAEAGDISFILASMPGGRPLYPNFKNWSPRLGLAYSPSGSSGLAKVLFGGEGKTSIRAGFGMYYDMIGQPLAANFANTMFGLSTSLSNPLNTLDAFNAPRFKDFYEIPLSHLPAAPPAGFPVKYPIGAFAITNSLDDQLKAPYTMNMNFSWGRDFGKGLFIQAAYVGRLSRSSLINRDVAMPTNLKDPKSGMAYFEAMQQLGFYTDHVDGNRSTSYTRIAPIPYFENLWAGAAGGGFTATQNIANFYVRSSNQGDFTNVLQAMDFTCTTTGTTFRSDGRVRYLNCSILGPDAMFTNQFGALSARSSIGNGNYHAAQLTVRKRLADLQFDFNYTLSKSIDLASGNESSGSWGGGVITNSWNPGERRAVSDYDTLHAINAYGVYPLPFGRGMRFGSKWNGFLDAILGGWQISGTYRQSSSSPTSTSTGSVWPTNWQLSNPAVPTGLPFPTPVVNKNGTLSTGSSNVSAFATQADAQAAIAAYRQSLPGEGGLRNDIRTWGSWNIDSALAKSFKMPYKEGHTVQIRWETFNMTNTPIMGNPGMSMTSTSTWGRISSQRNDPRRMQLAIRYDF